MTTTASYDQDDDPDSNDSGPDSDDTDTVPSATLHSVTIADDETGRRLDVVLAARLASLSRSRLQALIRAGAASSAGGTIGDPGIRVKPGDVFVVAVPPAAPAEPEGEGIPLAIVYEDDAVVVVDKPSGLVVHPAAGHGSGTLVNALIAHCGASLSGIGGVRRPGIVHRLDKDTSGLLVVAKTDEAHRGLAEQFASHGADGRLSRAYMALCWGCPTPRVGRIEADLARSAANRTRISVTRPGGAGRFAATHYTVERAFAAGDREMAVALLRLELETGRTHQIRVHMAHIGHPLLGDDVYGTSHKCSANLLTEVAREKLLVLGRQALHAAELGFEHPVTGQPLLFTSPLPADIAELLTALGEPVGGASRSRPRRR